MLFLINAIIAFLLILFQTTFLPHLPFEIKLFDLTLIVIIYLGFYRDYFESMVIIFLSGIVMDSLSGGAFGIYCSTYIWLFFWVKALVQYVHVKSLLLIPVVMAVAIFMENCLIAYSVAVKTGTLNFLPKFFGITVLQIFWCVFFGTFVYFAILRINQAFGRYIDRLFSSNQ